MPFFRVTERTTGIFIIQFYMNAKTWFFALSFLTLAGCRPEDDTGSTEVVGPALSFDCIHLTDPNGQPVGRYGDCFRDEDWTNHVLTTPERAYFNLPEFSTWGTDTPAEVIRSIAVFPNPVAPGGQLMLNLQLNKPTSPLLHLAIVDGDGQVPFARNIYLQEAAEVQVALFLPAEHFRPGVVYRLYYQLWARPDALLYEGYGDVLVCAVTDYSKIGEECF